jgi:hypothetical protein
MVRLKRALVLITIVAAATLALTPIYAFAQVDTWSLVPPNTTPPPGDPANTTTTITGTVVTPGSPLHPVKGVRVTLLFNNGGKLFHHNQITKSDGTYNFRNIKAHTPLVGKGVYRYVVKFEKEGFVPQTFQWRDPTHNPTTGPAADGKFIMLRPGFD